MLLTRWEIEIPLAKANKSIFKYYEEEINKHLEINEIQLRFVVTQSDSN